MWVLVYILISGITIDTAYIGQYDSLEQCFKEREYLMDDKGFPHPRTQAVCVRIDDGS